MKDGFYGVAVAPADQPEASDVSLLLHFKDNRMVGVDQGGCRLIGTYRTDSHDRVAVTLVYSVKAGVQTIAGATFDVDTDVSAALLLAPGTTRGEPQNVDIGLGPMTITLNWLADPA